MADAQGMDAAHLPAAQPAIRRMRPNLLTPRLLTLLNLLRRSASLTYRRTCDLSDFEWRIMAQAGEHACLSLNDLAELTGQDRGQLSRGVKGLCERGLLLRNRRPGGPGVQIELSTEGRRVFDQMIDLATSRNADLASIFNEEELRFLESALDRLTAIARHQLSLEQAKAGHVAGNSAANG